MNKFLVTGAAGLIGRYITKELVDQNYDVYSCYNKLKPEFGNLVHLDLTELDKNVETIHNINPDIIIHLAAITDVNMCETNKELCSLINTQSTKILSKEAAKLNAFFVYISTDYVFDGKNEFYKENDFTCPINYYGKTKLDSEKVLNNLASPYVIIRTSTPFGIHPKKKSFPLWVKENLENKKEISAIIDQYTSPTYVQNLTKMKIEISLKQITGIFHLAGKTRISRYEFALKIAEKFNLDKSLIKSIKNEEMSWAAKRPQDSSLNISKAEEILENKPWDIEKSLELLKKELNNQA